MRILFLTLMSLLLFVSCTSQDDIEYLEFDDVKFRAWSLTSVDSKAPYLDGELYKYTLTIEYNLVSTDEGLIEFGINSEKVDEFELLPDLTFPVKRGRGSKQVTLTTKFKDYGLEGTMSMIALLYGSLEAEADTLYDEAIFSLKKD